MRSPGAIRQAEPATTRACRLWLIVISNFLLLGACQQTTRDPGGVVMLIESSPVNLDPRIGTDAQSTRIGELIFDSLLRRDESAQLQPHVALSWETPDRLTYILKLRAGIRFHDGRPLRAQDARYTLETLISGELKSAKAGSFSRIASVESPDDETLLIRLKEPYASFLWNLTQGAFGIVPEGAGLNVGSDPVGSGPFRYLRATPEEEVVLQRNPAYWGGASQLESITFKIVPDATTRALELRKGSADLVVNALAADAVESLRREPHLAVASVPGNTYQYLGLNVASPKLPLPVRLAIAYGIDRDALIRHLWRGFVRPANSILPSGHWAFAAGLGAYEFNPDKAMAILDGGGYIPGPDGYRVRLLMKTSTDQAGRELAAVLQSQLARIGIRLDIQSYEFATFYADISKGNFELFSLRWIGGNEDPDIFDYVFHSSKVPPKGANRGNFRNADADQMIDAARFAPTIEARKPIYHRLQALLNQQLPYIHLWYLDSVIVHNRRLSNMRPVPDGSYAFLTQARSK